MYRISGFSNTEIGSSDVSFDYFYCCKSIVFNEPRLLSTLVLRI